VRVTPLQRIAMGLVVVVLDSSSAYDVLPDVAGWVLVVWGLAGLPGPDRGPLRVVALVAGVVSAVLWFPQVREPVADESPALAWAAAIPDYVFAILLCWAMSRLARPTDPRTAARFRLLMALMVVPALGPVLEAAVGSEGLVVAATVVGMVGWVWLIWTLFARHGREYAEPPAAAGAAGGS
jgi:hypothetical protein